MIWTGLQCSQRLEKLHPYQVKGFKGNIYCFWPALGNETPAPLIEKPEPLIKNSPITVEFEDSSEEARNQRWAATYQQITSMPQEIQYEPDYQKAKKGEWKNYHRIAVYKEPYNKASSGEKDIFVLPEIKFVKYMSFPEVREIVFAAIDKELPGAREDQDKLMSWGLTAGTEYDFSFLNLGVLFSLGWVILVFSWWHRARKLLFYWWWCVGWLLAGFYVFSGIWRKVPLWDLEYIRICLGDYFYQVYGFGTSPFNGMYFLWGMIVPAMLIWSGLDRGLRIGVGKVKDFRSYRRAKESGGAAQVQKDAARFI